MPLNKGKASEGDQTGASADTGCMHELALSRLLTIAIPTYNRSGLLRNLLHSIVAQSVWDSARMEIIVLNNASTDDTREVVSRFPEVTYTENETNIGGNGNVRKAGSAGAGKYVWIIGDDEVLLPGALDVVYKALQGGVSYLVLNHNLYRKTLRRAGPAFFQIEKDELMEDKNRALTVMHLGVGFISCVVYRRDQFEPLDEATYRHWEVYGFPQVIQFYRAVATKNLRGMLVARSCMEAGHAEGRLPDRWMKYFCHGVFLIAEELHGQYGFSEKAVLAFRLAVARKFYAGQLLHMCRVNDIEEFNRLRKFIIDNYRIGDIAQVRLLILLYLPFHLVKTASITAKMTAHGIGLARLRIGRLLN